LIEKYKTFLVIFVNYAPMLDLLGKIEMRAGYFGENGNNNMQKYL